MTAALLEDLGACWLVGAIRGAPARVDADLEHPLDAGTRLCAWRVGAGGDWSGLEAAVQRAAASIRPARGAILAIGTGRPHGRMLLGLTASAVERRARDPGRWRRHPVLSRRLREALERIPHDPAALELRARSRPRDGRLWWAWGAALRRTGRYREAARALRRAVLVTPPPAAPALLQELSVALLGDGDAKGAEWYACQVVAQAATPAAEVEARFTLAGAWLATGRLELAEAAFRELVEAALDRGDRFLAARALRRRVVCLTALGQHAKADRALAAALDPPDDPAGASVAEAVEACELHAAWAENQKAAGLVDEAEGHLRTMLAVASRYGLVHAARRARVALAWTSLRSGALQAAVAGAEGVLEETRASDPALAAVAAYVAAEVRFQMRDHAAADRLLAVAEAGPRGPTRGESGPLCRVENLEWMVASLRGRMLRRAGLAERAQNVLEAGIGALERAPGWALGRHVAVEWQEERVPLYGLAVENAAALGAWDAAVVFAEAAGTRIVRERPADGDKAPRPTPDAIAAGLVLLADAGVDAVTLACGAEDLLVVHHGPDEARFLVPGAAPLVRRLVSEIQAAQAAQGPLQALLAILGRSLEAPLSPLARHRRPLALVPHGILRAVPWDLVPLHGRALTAVRPTAELLSLGMVDERGPRGGEGAVLLGPGRTLQPALADALEGAVPDGVRVVRDVGAVDLVGALSRGWSLVLAEGGPKHLDLAGGALTVPAVLERRLPPGVVLLGNAWAAACRGPEGLAAALLAAGASAVVAPVGPVGEAECARFLGELATRLARGEPLLSAFHAARSVTAASLGPWGWSALAPFRVMTRSVCVLAGRGGA